MDNPRRLWDDKLGAMPAEARRIATADMTRQPLFETIVSGRSGFEPGLEGGRDDANRQRGRFARAAKKAREIARGD